MGRRALTFGQLRRSILVLVALLAAIVAARASAPPVQAQTFGTIEWEQSSYTVVEGERLVIGVERSGGADEQVFASWSTIDGAPGAEAGVDFAGAGQRFAVFPDGVSNVSVTIDTTEDALVEGDELFTIMLDATGGKAGLGTLVLATVLIIDNDGPSAFAFSAAAYSVGEGDGPALVTVTRSGAGAGGDSVDLTLTNGTAVEPGDYTGPGPMGALTTTVVFGVGELTKMVAIAIVNDTAPEADESLAMTLSNPMGASATIGLLATATLTINDNDGPGKLQFAAATTTVDEDSGTVNLVVERVDGSNGTVTVDCATGGGTATPTFDYVTLPPTPPTTLTFAEGVTSQICPLVILPDEVVEADETVNLALGNPTGGAVLGTQTTTVVTITDNDIGDVFDFLHDGYEVVEEGVAFEITVTRTGNLNGTATVTYQTGEIASGATSGVDFGATMNVLVFSDGEAMKTFTLAILEDTLVETKEGLSLTLSAPSLGTSIGTSNPIILDILDDDGDPPAIIILSIAEGPAAGGTTVVLTGTRFVDVQSVRFGTIAATSFTVTSATSLTAVSPEHDEGDVNITVTTPSGSSVNSALDRFTFLGEPPKVDSLEPAIGPTDGNTVVTLTGKNFTGATAVTFGGALGTDLTVMSDTVITVRAPARPPGTVNVRVIGPDGTSTDTGTNNDYEYLEGGGTVTYTLSFRWVLIVWAGADGAAVEAALRGQGHPDATDVFDRVSVLFTWNATLEIWLGFFTQAVTDNIPSANDFTTFERGRAYWVATKIAGAAIWIIAGN